MILQLKIKNKNFYTYSLLQVNTETNSSLFQMDA